MASSQDEPERHSLRNDNGRFARVAPRKKNRKVNGRKTLGSLRGVAFRLIVHLENSLPNKTPPKCVAARKGTAVKTVARDGSSTVKVEWTAADYDRLLGRNGGVIESFKTLADLILRLFEMERDPVDNARPAPDFTEDDEEDLDRRIADELDRLAERQGSADAA